MGLVHPRWLELSHIEERVSREQADHWRGAAAKHLHLGGEPIDAAQWTTGASAGLEVAFEVRHYGDAKVGRVLSRGRLVGLAAPTAERGGQNHHDKQASHPPVSSNRAAGRKKPGRPAA